jgi:membrane protein implicated in regulation of membrane protease activity
MWQFWIVLAGVFFVIEAFTIGFLVFWFGIGAILAMIVSFFTDSLLIQTLVFLISSTVLLFFTRPFVNKFSENKETQTNAFSIIGKKGIVTKTIDPITGQGQIKVGSEVWSAKSKNEVKIEKGYEVEVLEIDGVKAVVR